MNKAKYKYEDIKIGAVYFVRTFKNKEYICECVNKDWEDLGFGGTMVECIYFKLEDGSIIELGLCNIIEKIEECQKY